MNCKTRTLLQVFFICALAVASQIAQAQSSTMPAMPMTEPNMQMHKDMMGSNSMKKSMMTGMDRMNTMTMTGDTDKDFAIMMKIHHQQAVDMSEMQLAHGKSPAMKRMARNIIAAQKKEIASFDQWLALQK